MTSLDPISLVMLAFNEATTIEKEIREYQEKVISRLPGSEIIVAEDGSSDGTTEILTRLEMEGLIRHLTSPVRKGYRKALLDAVSSTRNPYVFFTDTGLKQDPEDFWKLYEVRQDNDLVIGLRSDRNDQFHRRLFTWGYNAFIRILFKAPQVNDCDSGFRLFNRRVVQEVFQSGKLFFKELPSSEIVLRTLHQALRYREIPVKYFQREGVSRGLPPGKIPKVILSSIRNLLKLRYEFSR